MRSSLLFLFLFFSVTANAYVPHVQTVLARVANNDGRGIYSIEQEVTFSAPDTEGVILREKWLVENGSSLRVTVTGVQTLKTQDAIHYEALYRDGKKITATGSAPQSQDFFEPLFHFRSAKSLLDFLVREHFIGPAYLRDRAKIGKIENFEPASERLIRLSRTGGLVSYFLGEPTPVQSERLNPGVWIEQDGFHILKARSTSQAEVAAEQFSSYANGLQFPRERTFTWDNNSARVRLLSIKALPDNANTLSQLQKTALADHAAEHLPEQKAVREFYSRFR